MPARPPPRRAVAPSVRTHSRLIKTFWRALEFICAVRDLIMHALLCAARARLMIYGPALLAAAAAKINDYVMPSDQIGAVKNEDRSVAPEIY